MNRNPFGIERRLTPELFDHYVAKARAERSMAIAEFGGHIARWLSGLGARLAGHGDRSDSARARAAR